MSRINELYQRLTAQMKDSRQSDDSPKGYTRTLHTLANGETTITLFSDRSIVRDIELGGEMWHIAKKNNKYYVFSKEHAIQHSLGDADRVDIDTIPSKLEKMGSNFKYVTDLLKERVKNATPYDSIISKTEVDIIKKAVKRTGKYSSKNEVTVTISKGALYVDNGYLFRSNSKITASDISFDAKALSGSVELYIKGGEIIDAEDSSRVFSLPTEKHNEKVRELNNTSFKHLPLKISDKKTLNIIKKTAKSVDDKNMKFEFRGVSLKSKGGVLEIGGTDMRILTVTSVKTSLKDFEIIIPKYEMDAEIKALSFNDDDGGQVTTEYSDGVLIGSKIHGRIYDYSRIIPDSANRKEITVDSKALLKILPTSKIDQVYFSAKDSKLELYTIEAVGKKREVTQKKEVLGTIDARGGIDDFIVDPKYMIEAIEGSGKATISVRESNLPIVVEVDGTKNIIMPVVLETEESIREHERRKAQEEREYQEEMKKEEGVAHDYLNTLEPKRRGSARKKLLSLVQIDGGEIMGRKDHIKQLVEKGYKPEFSEWTEYSRRLGRNIEKSGWYLVQMDMSTNAVSNTYAETKIEADFAKYLIEN